MSDKIAKSVFSAANYIAYKYAKEGFSLNDEEIKQHTKLVLRIQKNFVFDGRIELFIEPNVAYANFNENKILEVRLGIEQLAKLKIIKDPLCVKRGKFDHELYKIDSINSLSAENGYSVMFDFKTSLVEQAVQIFNKADSHGVKKSQELFGECKPYASIRVEGVEKAVNYTGKIVS